MQRRENDPMEVQTLRLEIRDLKELNNLKVKELQIAKETISNLRQQLENQNQTIEKRIQKEKEELASLLEKEREDHEFTKMLLDEESKKVELGIEMIRMSQKNALEWEQQKKAFQHYDTALRQSKKGELEKEKELAEIRTKYERLETELARYKNTSSVEKKAFEGMISIFKIQLEQLKKESNTFEQLFKNSQENWKNEKLMKGEDLDQSIETSKQTNRQLFSLNTLETTKETLNKELSDLLSKNDPSTSSNHLLKSVTEITSKYHKEVLLQIKSLLNELTAQKEYLKALRKDLELERESEEMLIDTISSLQEQVSVFTNCSRNFAISVLDFNETKIELGADHQNK